MILLDRTISDLACKCCGGTRDVYRILVGRAFDSADHIYLCENCRKDFIKKLNDTVIYDGDPEEHGGKWFQLWKQDKESILATMHKNLAADLDAGYNYSGDSIQSQLNQIEAYQKEFENQLMDLAQKEDGVASRWCYYDLKKRGAIE